MAAAETAGRGGAHPTACEVPAAAQRRQHGDQPQAQAFAAFLCSAVREAGVAGARSGAAVGWRGRAASFWTALLLRSPPRVHQQPRWKRWDDALPLGWSAPLLPPPPPPPHARASNRPALSLPSAPSAGGLPVQQWWILPPRRRRWRQSCPPASGRRPATTWRHGANGGCCATLLRLAFCRRLQHQPACKLAGCTFRAPSSLLAAACIPSCRYMDDSDADQRKPHRCGGQWPARGLACTCCALMHATRALGNHCCTMLHCTMLRRLPRHASPPARPRLVTHPSTPPHTRRRTPNEPCPPEVLHALGCRVWVLDPSKYPADPQLAAIRKARGYNYDVRHAGGGGS